MFFLKNIYCYQIGSNCNISRKASFKGLYGKVKIGDNCIIEPNVRIKFAQNIENNKFVIEIGNNVFIGFSSIIDAGISVKIEDNVMIGPNVFITDSNHILNKPDVPIALQGGKFEKVVIEKNVWIGSGCQILPGVIIRKNSIVGAGSTLISQVNEDGVLIVGSPGRIKKKLFLDNQ
ncbi:MAG TPA: acyltransferase [Edaphocola sp.]|nr:acyltransferase [Edaphocola sp.]